MCELCATRRGKTFIWSSYGCFQLKAESTGHTYLQWKAGQRADVTQYDILFGFLKMSRKNTTKITASPEQHLPTDEQDVFLSLTEINVNRL